MNGTVIILLAVICFGCIGSGLYIRSQGDNKTKTGWPVWRILTSIGGSAGAIAAWFFF